MLRKTQSWFVAEDDLEFENRGRFYEDSSCEAHPANWHGQQVTVKRVELKTNGDRARFVSEVETWHRLNHPHVVHLFGACDASPAFLVWENLEFRPLMSYVCQQPRRIWKTLYEAALGLQYLHSTHVLHGDLRGDNILVGSNEISKLGYFNFDLVEPSAPESEAEARKVSKMSDGWLLKYFFMARSYHVRRTYILLGCPSLKSQAEKFHGDPVHRIARSRHYWRTSGFLRDRLISPRISLLLSSRCARLIRVSESASMRLLTGYTRSV